MSVIVHYDTSAMKRFLTSVSLQHESKASDVITLVTKTFFRTSIVRNFISRSVKMRISGVKPHLRTRSDIKRIIQCHRLGRCTTVKVQIKQQGNCIGKFPSLYLFNKIAI